MVIKFEALTRLYFENFERSAPPRIQLVLPFQHEAKLTISGLRMENDNGTSSVEDPSLLKQVSSEHPPLYYAGTNTQSTVVHTNHRVLLFV